MIKSWLNGSDSRDLPLTDRGLLYGDGFFSTVAVLDAEPLLWQQHLKRIQESARRLGLNIEISRFETWLSSFLSESPIPKRCILKVLFTRTESGRAYHWGENSSVNYIFQLFEYTDFENLLQLRQSGLRLQVCKTPLSKNKLLAGLKHLNRLEQVLAASELDKTRVDEGVMLDLDDWVIEGTMSNIFMARGDKLLSPGLESSGVAGVMRGYLLESFSSNAFQLETAAFKLEQLLSAEAIFMSNALWGLCPVKSITGTDWQADQTIVSQILSSVNLNEVCF